MDFIHVITDAVTGEVTTVPFTEEEIVAFEKDFIKKKEEQASINRALAYREESDPLFFKWQRDEATEQEWLDKVAEIKARYPKE